MTERRAAWSCGAFLPACEEGREAPGGKVVPIRGHAA
jgi:hypothetical protein